MAYAPLQAERRAVNILRAVELLAQPRTAGNVSRDCIRLLVNLECCAVAVYLSR